MMELWPFTNFHDLNLDWIIKTVNHWADANAEFFDHGARDLVEEVTPEVVADWFENEAQSSPVFTGAVEDATLEWFNESAATSPVFTGAVQNSTENWFENDAATSTVFTTAVSDAVADYADTNGIGFKVDANGGLVIG